MKKIFLLCITLISYSCADTNLDILKKFVDDYKTCYPHPNWVVKEYFLKMNLNEFKAAFNFLVTRLVNLSTRWHYLYDSQKQFKEDEVDRKEFLEHLKTYDQFFSKIGINEQDNCLKYFENSKESIFQAIKFEGSVYYAAKDYLKSSLNQYYAAFYALYLKYLSDEFLEKCKEYSKAETKEKKRKVTGQMLSVFDTISKITTTTLKDTQYEREALRLFERYELIVCSTY